MNQIFGYLLRGIWFESQRSFKKPYPLSDIFLDVLFFNFLWPFGEFISVKLTTLVQVFKPY